jgi:hypothetical protein
MSKTEILTAAFNKGFETGKAGHDGIPASLRFKGKAEDFYWAGYKKGAAELEVWRASPEYKAQRAKQRESMVNLAHAVNAMFHGKHELARHILNDEIGLNIR